MSFEPNPAQWSGALQWYAQNTYALNKLVVYTPASILASNPGAANVYMCTTAVTTPTATTPDVDTAHWTFVVTFFPNAVQDSDTFLHLRQSINSALYAVTDMHYRQIVDETDLQNILINNMAGYTGARAGLQARLVYDELDITNLLTNNMSGYSSPRNGLQARLNADETAIANILQNTMSGYSAPLNGLQLRLVADESDISSILTNTMPTTGPKSALAARLTTDEAAIATINNLGLLANRGAWAASTVYRKGDAVTAGPFGSLYTCAIANTSTSNFATDLSSGKWVILLDLTGAVLNYTIQTASFSALPGYSYFVDVSGGAINVTLPATASLGGPPITITHIDGDVTVNALTILSNGLRIMGVADNMAVDKNYASFRLVYSDALRGWRTTIL